MKTGPEHGVVFSKTATFARGSRELSAECFVDWALFVKTLWIKQDLKKSMTASFARHCTFFACHYMSYFLHDVARHYMSYIFAWHCTSLHVIFFAWRCTSLHVIYFYMSLHIIVCSGYPIFFHVTPSLHSIASRDMTLWIFSYCIIASDCMSTVFASDCTSTVFASDCKATTLDDSNLSFLHTSFLIDFQIFVDYCHQSNLS